MRMLFIGASLVFLTGSCGGPKNISSTPPLPSEQRDPLQKPLPLHGYTCFLNEPFWTITIDPKGGISLERIGEKTLVFPYSTPQKQVGALIYQSDVDQHELKLTIRPLPCSDSMSGKEFAHSVSATLDNFQHVGCAQRNQ